jgi:hypothetical protein
MSDRSRYQPSVSLKGSGPDPLSSSPLADELFASHKRERDPALCKEDQKASISFESWKSQFFRLVQDGQLVTLKISHHFDIEI